MSDQGYETPMYVPESNLCKGVYTHFGGSTWHILFYDGTLISLASQYSKLQ